MVRDAGGIALGDGRRMRTGVAYRFAGALTTPEDLDVLARAGIRTLVDMRDEGEGREGMQAWAAAHGARYVPAPMVIGGYAGGRWDAMVERIAAGEGPTVRRDAYAQLALDFGPQQAAALDALTADGPVAFGCATGKDRTGVLNVYLQVLLGASEDDAVAHYLATAPDAARMEPTVQRFLPAGSAPEILQLMRDYMAVQAENMHEVLDLVRGRGGAEAFLLDAGMDPATPERLRLKLVE